MKNKLLNLCVDNEFLDKYIELINGALDRKSEKYKTQRHHIVPRYYYKSIGIGVDNTKNNIVNLYFSEHIIAHYLLALCSLTKEFKFYNECALHHMTGSKEIFSKEWVEENTPLINELYEERRKIHGEKSRGRKFSKESSERLSTSLLNTFKTMRFYYVHKDDETHRIRVSELDSYLKLGFKRGMSPKIIQKIANSNRGGKATESAKQKLSASHTGLISIYYGDEEKRIRESELDMYLNFGWKMGRSERVREKISKNSFGKAGTFKGKEHSPLSKEKIGKKNSGGVYVNNGEISKHIRQELLESYLSSGWKIGNISNKRAASRWVTNGVETFRVKECDVKRYMNLGFIVGRTFKK